VIARGLLLVPPIGRSSREGAMDCVFHPLPPIQDREGAQAGKWSKSMRENVHRLGGDSRGVEPPKWGTPWDGLGGKEVNHCGDVIRDATM
jgi:hypothetical protein